MAITITKQWCSSELATTGLSSNERQAQQVSPLTPAAIVLILRVTVGQEPLDRICKGLAWRSLRQAKFADGFCGIEKHFIGRHADARQRHTRGFLRKIGVLFT